jgi:hypothetical protein
MAAFYAIALLFSLGLPVALAVVGAGVALALRA